MYMIVKSEMRLKENLMRCVKESLTPSRSVTDNIICNDPILSSDCSCFGSESRFLYCMKLLKIIDWVGTRSVALQIMVVVAL